VVVDDRIDARVEVRQTAEEHAGRHIRVAGWLLVEEADEQVDVNRQPQHCEEDNDQHEQSTGVTLLVLPVALLLAGSQGA